MTATVYVEGGGNSKALRSECRKGFRQFFENAGLKGRMPSIVACGSRQTAFNDYVLAVAKPGNNRFCVLLVDSEGPVAEEDDSWAHVKKQDNWDRPQNAEDDGAHLMVQCMESWFLADKANLAAYFGQQFNANALPGNPNIEEIPKNDVLQRLRSASRQCAQKGAYDKGRDAFKILSGTDPSEVKGASPYARHLVDTLLSKAGLA